MDYQNLYTFLGVLSQRQLFVTVANALIDAGEEEKALEIQQLCETCFPEENFPLETISLGFAGNDYMVAQMIENYYYLGDAESARDMAGRMAAGLLDTAAFFLEWGNLGGSEFDSATRVLLYIADVCRQYGDKELSKSMTGALETMLHAVAGDYAPEEELSDTPEID